MNSIKKLIPILARIPYTRSIPRHAATKLCYSNVPRITRSSQQMAVKKKPYSSNVPAAASEKSKVAVDFPPPPGSVVPDISGVNSTNSETEFNEETIMLQLHKCGRLSHVKALAARRENQQTFWQQLQENKKLLTTNVYNTYIQVCIDNEMPLPYKSFLQMVPGVEPNHATYLLLLKLASHQGDVNEAVELLTEMKEHGMSADEHVFNALIVGYTLHKGLEGANYVLGTMKLAQIAISSKTNWAILVGLVRFGERAEFRQFLEIIPKLSQTDAEYMELLYALGARGQHAWLEDILGDFDWDAMDHTFANAVQDMCLDLVHRAQPDAAVYFYNTFIDPTPGKPYGKHLLKEMLAANTPIERVIEAARKMLAKNASILFDLASITLRRGMVAESYKTFECLSYLRPHFFWPILQAEARQNGEPGVLSVLKKMDLFNVKPDYTTLEEYVLPYCNQTKPKAVMESITSVPNIMQRDVLSPMIAVLLKDKRVDDAKELCVVSNKIPLAGDALWRLVATAWDDTKSPAVVTILQKICETNTTSVDWTGKVLERCMKVSRTISHCQKLLGLMKQLAAAKLKINSSSYDHLMQLLGTQPELEKFKTEIETHLERLLDISLQASARIPHPKDMNISELEDHFVELEAKNMETRGVVRKLILAHAQSGNLRRVQELRDYMKAHKYDETAGMKSALFHSLVLSSALMQAKTVYEELKTTYPSFRIDSFKMVDFATLLVRSGAVDDALSVLSKETKPIKVDHSMDRNCWLLLGAAKRPEDAFRLFQLLVERNYCKPTHVILGPILRPFVNDETVDKLVCNFCNCAEQYNATPLQLEVLCVVLEAKSEALLQRVIDAITKVHGPAAARVGLIAALAEKGLEKPILKLLSERSQVKVADLSSRIQRWVNEDKLMPLLVLEAANRRLSISAFDNSLTSSAVMKIYCNRADFSEALTFWHQLEENEGRISKECAKEVVQLLHKHNIKVPESLVNYSTS